MVGRSVGNIRLQHTHLNGRSLTIKIQHIQIAEITWLRQKFQINTETCFCAMKALWEMFRIRILCLGTRIINEINCLLYLYCLLLTASVVERSEFLATDPEIRVRSPTLHIFWKVVGLERDPFNLVSIIEELLVRNSSGSGLENREYGRRDPSRWPRDMIYPQRFGTNFADKWRSIGGLSPRNLGFQFYNYSYYYYYYYYL
jgi:hypothetical protein